ncbi:hypothetical protein V6Z12_D03G149100 [Gossypium hirsutum]
MLSCSFRWGQSSLLKHGCKVSIFGFAVHAFRRSSLVCDIFGAFQALLLPAHRKSLVTNLGTSWTSTLLCKICEEEMILLLHARIVMPLKRSRSWLKSLSIED